MRRYMIDKHARKMRDREKNRELHEHSPRHTFNPSSLDCLKEKRDAIYATVPDTFKHAECIRILKTYKVRGSFKSYTLAELERAINHAVLITRDKNDLITKAVDLARDATANRFTPNKLRRHYHRIHSGEPGYKTGNKEYDEYEYILQTWYMVYGQRWDGEPYHIDHIKPLRSVRTPQGVRRLNKLDNLAMISQHDNLSKRDRFPHPIYYIIRNRRWDNG